MAIQAPGKRPGARLEHSKVFGKKFVRGKKIGYASLMLTSLVDMFTIIVIFLLMNFSANGEVLYMSKDIKLPDAFHGAQLDRAPVISVSNDAVTFDGRQVASTADLTKGDLLNVPALEDALRDERRRYEQIHQNEPDRGEMAQPREVVRPVRIYQRIDFRQFFAGLVMVDDDDRHAKLPRFRQRLDTGGAAIDGDEQRGALSSQRAHRLDVGAIALEDAVGDVDQGIEPAMAQMPGQQRRRGRTVDVVIAEDRDLLGARGRIRNAPRRRLHRRHGMGIGHQLADGLIEKILDLVDPDIAARQHARQHLRQLVALRDRQRPRRPPGIEPVAPQFAGRRTRHAEKGRRLFNGNCGCGKRHDAFEE